MKRLDRYAAQLELLSEAAFVVVRRDGPDALSRRGLAAELGASDAMARRTLAHHASLPALAARACEVRRNRARRFRPLVDQLLPDPEGVDAEVVWLRLQLRHGTVAALAGGDDLVERYQMATRGWSDAQMHPAPDATDATDGDESAAATADQRALTPYLTDHETTTQALVTRLVDERHDLVAPVQALVDGLVLAVCTGRLTAPAARGVLVEHLATLGVAPTAAPPAPPPP